MKPSPRTVEAIRREMVRIRRRHHDDIAEIIGGADAVIEWGRNIGSYYWPILCGTALSWIVAHWRATFPKKWTGQENAATTDELINNRRTDYLTRSATRATWPGEAATLLATVASRAAQHYAAHRLDDLIASRRLAHSTKTQSDQGRLCDDFLMPNTDCIPAERLSGACGENQS
jgi:hypothetical protein